MNKNKKKHQSNATSLVASLVKLGAIGRIIASQAERASRVLRGVLPHDEFLAGSGCDSRALGASPGARLGNQRAGSIHAVRHVAHHPQMTAQLHLLLGLPALAVGLALAAVHAKVDVANAPVLAVITGVRVYGLDELGVAAVQAIDQTRRYQRLGRIQANDLVHPEEQVIGHQAANVRAQRVTHAGGTGDWQTEVSEGRQRLREATCHWTHVGHCCWVTWRLRQFSPVNEEDVVAAVSHVGVAKNGYWNCVVAT